MSTRRGSSNSAQPMVDSAQPMLGLSVFWGYLAGVCLVVVPLLFVVENPIAVLANLRIVDELADLGIVRDVDVGTGFIDGVPEVIAHSRRPISWNLLWLAFACVVGGAAIRAFRQGILATRAGIPATVPGRVVGYFWGRGLNVLFPFGPGDLATARRLRASGAPPDAAANVVFQARIAEVAGIGVFFAVALALSGWKGTLAPYLLSVAVVLGLTWAIRPAGRHDGARSATRRSLWSAVNGPEAVAVVTDLGRTPASLAGILALSTGALSLDLAGLYLLKQSFSTREFLMLSDLPAAGLIMALGVASLARVVPLTPAGAGFYELTMVAVFVAYGEDPAAATTVAVLDGVFTSAVAILLFVPAALVAPRGSGTLEAWREFLQFSRRPASDDQARI